MALILVGPYTVVAGEDKRFLVTTDDDPTAWSAATLTVRADPDYPRYHPVEADEDEDLAGWAVVLQVSDFLALTATTYQLTATRAETALLPVGHRRCVIDVWRTDGAGNNVYADVRPTWLDVVSPAYPLP